MEELNERVKEGWRISARGYSGMILQEIQDGMDKRWKNIIMENAPRPGRLKILDVGTGPGFFALILSKAGHDVTGIDASPDMIECAIENCREAGADAELLVMDSQTTNFDENTFDMIVSRNVVWTLVKPDGAYRDWRRILKPGGRLVVFDGNWSDPPDPIVKEQQDKDRAEYVKKYGEPPMSYKKKDEDTARGWKRDMPLNGRPRPEWDKKTLTEIGYKNVGSKFILDEVFDEKRKLLHRANPMFMVWAEK
jgi:ubiquinone/menaquinone biosynthesis C-methylase UbiE